MQALHVKRDKQKNLEKLHVKLRLMNNDHSRESRNLQVMIG
jgi:hypothetical protein